MNQAQLEEFAKYLSTASVFGLVNQLPNFAALVAEIATIRGQLDTMRGELEHLIAAAKQLGVPPPPSNTQTPMP
jgi:hypothetical protein